MTVSDIVLIHGAWNRGVCYDAVVPLLRDAGYRVSAPDLASHAPGDGGHLSVRDMDAYTEPAARIIRNAEGGVVVLGHSMGGASVSWLAERFPDRVAGLIYLTAFLTPPGVPPMAFIVPDESGQGTPEALELLTPVDDNRGLRADLSRAERFREVFMGDYPADLPPPSPDQFVETQTTVPVMTPNPMGERALAIPRLYIEALDDRAIPIAVQRRMHTGFPGPVEVASLPTSHAPYYSAPAPLAEIILRFTRSVAERTPAA